VVDFFRAAFPWIAGGIAVAIILVYGKSKRDMKNNKKQ
jgi:hypothetical protein